MDAVRRIAEPPLEDGVVLVHRVEQLTEVDEYPRVARVQGTHVGCGRRITDSLIGQNVTIPNHEQNLPKGHRLILGDKATVTL